MSLPFFFRAKLSLLLRARNVVKASRQDCAVTTLAILNELSEYTSLDEVAKKVGGQKRAFQQGVWSVIDEEEKVKLTQFSKKRKAAKLEMVQKEYDELVCRSAGS